MAINLRQSQFAFGLDNGTEASHTLGAIGANFVAPLDTPFLLRFSIWETGGTNAPNLVQQFQYSRNGGTWTDITTTSTVVKAVAVGAFTNGQNCTRRLDAHGTFESSGAGCTEDGSSGGNANDLLANGSTETECGLQIISTDVAQGDDIEFRVRVSGPTTTIGYDTSPHALVPLSKTPAAASLSVSGVTPIINSLISVAVGALLMAGPQPTATAATLTAQLTEGATVRATRQVPLTSSSVTSAFVLTDDEVSSITDWSVLRFSFIANGPQAEVSWAELETPIGVGDSVALPGRGELGFSGYAPSTTTAFTFRLSCGSTIIADRQVVLTSSHATQSFALTAGEVAAITDWSALRFSFIANTQQAEVAWAELEAPEIASGLAPRGGTLAFSGLAPVVPVIVRPDAGALAFTSTAQTNREVQLWMGPSATGTLVAYRELNFTSSFATYEFALNASERAAITDWTDLHLVIVADVLPYSVSWVEVEAPEPGNAPAVASLAFTGAAPLINTIGQGGVTAGTVAFAGTTPTLDRTYKPTPAAGALALSGTTPSPLAVLITGRGTLTLTGLAPLLSSEPIPTFVAAEDGSFAFAGLAPSPRLSLTVAPPSGSLAVSGVTPTTARTYLSTPAASTVAFGGAAPLVSVSSASALTKAPDVAALALAGGAVYVVQAPIGPVAICWGSEAIVGSGISAETLVSARLTGDTVECVT